jgi:hypothetical protein
MMHLFRLDRVKRVWLRQSKEGLVDLAEGLDETEDGGFRFDR